ncbi:MAG: phenylalanine--tRNA ligase subunit beta [archaeon]
MPTISVNLKEFEKLVGKKLPLDKLKERISYLGTDLEKIENNQIDVEIFPDRPDMLSLQGFARAFSSFIGVKTGLKKYTVKKSNEKVIIDSSVKNVRPYTVCAIVKNLKFDDERIKDIIQIQEKLHITYGRNRKKAAIGIYPFEKIKCPIRFMAKKPSDIKFQPLESQKELTGNQILSQHPAGREYAHLLDGLDKYSIFIDANNEILSMPPIINSHKTGKITGSTKEVFIECSGFDFNVLKICLNIIVTALADMNGEVYSMELKYPDKTEITPNLDPKKMKINLKTLNNRLGLNLKEAEVKKYLERMGYSYSKNIVLIPCYRADILHEVDIYEDIAIAYGYENFKEEIPNISTVGEEDKFESFRNKIANTLIGFNLLEVSSFHLTNNETVNNLNSEQEAIKVENASYEYDTLRPNLISNLLKILKENKRYDYPQKIFEIGKIFKKNPKEETSVQEDTNLCVLISHNSTGFTEIKQILDYLFNSLNLEYKLEELENSSFITGRTGKIILKNNKEIGLIGEIHPKVLNNFTLEMPVSCFELNLGEIFELL